MKAKIGEMKANLVEAECKIPLAMSDALQSGRFSIIDYYKMKNIIADTDMRKSISVTDSGAPSKAVT